MKWVKSFILAFSMYSRIPMPQIEFKDGDGKYSFCFFPFVGVVIGLLEFFWFGFCQKMNFANSASFEQNGDFVAGTHSDVSAAIGNAGNGFSQICVVCIAAAIPLIVTGGFHMDGFLDVTDALSSYRNTDEKERILRDPHIGAFAVIGLAIAGLIFVGCLSEIHTVKEVCFFAGSFALARIFSGLAAFYLQKFDARDNLTRTVAMQERKVVLPVLWLELLAWMCGFGLLDLRMMMVEMVAMAGVFCYYRWKMMKEFGGTVGDTAGWYVVVQEVVYVIVLVVFDSIA